MKIHPAIGDGKCRQLGAFLKYSEGKFQYSNPLKVIKITKQHIHAKNALGIAVHAYKMFRSLGAGERISI